jgi:hypothetical protein
MTLPGLVDTQKFDVEGFLRQEQAKTCCFLLPEALTTGNRR